MVNASVRLGLNLNPESLKKEKGRGEQVEVVKDLFRSSASHSFVGDYQAFLKWSMENWLMPTANK